MHGSFDIDSFLTFYYSNEEELKEVGIMVNEDQYAALGKETFPLESISLIQDKIDINVFHEQVHYWQAMTSTIIVLNYLNLSKLLHCRAKTLGLKEERISNTFPQYKDDIESFEYSYKCHRMNFASPKGKVLNLFKSAYKQYLERGNNVSWQEFLQHIKEDFKTKLGKSIYESVGEDLGFEPGAYNIISDEPPLAMPFITYEHLQKGKGFLAYGGVLDYVDLVYFTGDNLQESFAVINECLKDNSPFPQYDAIGKRENNMYAGTFEVYRRMHSKRYKSDKELAISFLALIDLCFTTDPFGNHDEIYENDRDFLNENTSIPYRFGKLIFRAMGFRPFALLEGSDIAEAIKEWQDDFCKYQGLFLPDDCLRNTITQVLLTLINDFYVNQASFNDSEVLFLLDLYDKLKMNDSSWVIIASQVVKILNYGYQNYNGILTHQNHTLLSITNALFFKLNHRGECVVPCYYETLLKNSIEPHLFIVDGQYAYSSGKDFYPSPLRDQLSFVFPPIESMVLRAMAKKGIKTCGFSDAYFPCRFISNGLGCPLFKMTPDEERVRMKRNLPLDWCHYNRLMKLLSAKS